MIDMERRKTLKTGCSIGLISFLTAVGLIQPEATWAKYQESAFDTKSMTETLEALGVVAPEINMSVHLTVPEIAENGAVVPVTVASFIEHTEQIYILVEKNPNVLAASFVFPDGTDSFVTTRVKMRETSMVIALVKANGKFYRATKEVKVTAGGCGG